LITNDITNAISSAAESSIPSKSFEKYILNKFALSISSNIKLSLWRIGGILISDPFIPEICLTMFHQFLQEEFMFVEFFQRKLGLTFSY
jgi:hypothetical protein